MVVATLFLVVAWLQVAHSIEEYLGKFYEQTAEASTIIRRVLPSFPIVRMDRDSFVVLNMILIGFIMWIGYFLALGYHFAIAVATIIAGLEIVNGVAHVAYAFRLKRYFPGSISGSFLAIAALSFLLA